MNYWETSHTLIDLSDLRMITIPDSRCKTVYFHFKDKTCFSYECDSMKEQIDLLNAFREFLKNKST